MFETDAALAKCNNLKVRGAPTLSCDSLVDPLMFGWLFEGDSSCPLVR
jgi:hypothetical protein